MCESPVGLFRLQRKEKSFTNFLVLLVWTTGVVLGKATFDGIKSFTGVIVGANQAGGGGPGERLEFGQ